MACCRSRYLPICQKVICINPLIKITIQSKALFPIALHCATMPNSASDRQTMPQTYNRMKLIGSLPLNDGRMTGSPYFRKSRRHTIKLAVYTACKIAGMQESKFVLTAGKRERLLPNYPARLIAGIG